MTEPSTDDAGRGWVAGPVPIAVVMISLNEGHNIAAVIENLRGFAQEVFLVDSFSSDNTVDYALSAGVHVVQRRFRGFGDQWNFAMRELPITAPWTMKLDPDERLTEPLKQAIAEHVRGAAEEAFRVRRRLWFMGRPLPTTQVILRGWRTGTARFSDVLVNEHPIVDGPAVLLTGDLEHHDSPDLHHWYDKQNRYSSAEAIGSYRNSPLSARPRLLGSSLERRMWLKSIVPRLPFRSLLVFLYCYIWLGSWRAGRVGFIWAGLRANVYRMRALKLLEMRWKGQELRLPAAPMGLPHPQAIQADTESDG